MKINKLTANDVRREWQSGTSQDDCAAMYGCSRQYINQIILNQQYPDETYSYEKTKAMRDTAIQLQKLYAKVSREKATARAITTEQKAKLSYLEILENHLNKNQNQE